MSSAADFGSARPTLAGGIIEIAALTTLIGASTAESLMLGSRGAAGVLWASMSVFGVVALIKAAVTAATPSGLRETLGVRSMSTDQSIGLTVSIYQKNIHARLSLDPVVGIQNELRKVGNTHP